MRQVARISSVLMCAALLGCKHTTYNPRYFGAGYGGITGGMGTPLGGNGQSGTPAAGAMGKVQAADTLLQQAQYRPAAQLMQAELQQNQPTSFTFMAQPGFCYAVFALGETEAKDIDLQVASPNGEPLIHENSSGNHPNGTFCAKDFGMHFARITMLSGVGRVYLGAYQGPSGSSVNLASLFDSNTQTIAQATGGPDAQTATRAQALQTQLEAHGYKTVIQMAGYSMNAGQTLRWPTTLQAGYCYAFASFAGTGAQNTNLQLFDAPGEQTIATDSRNAADALIQEICPDTTQGYQLRPALAQGQGALWFVALARPNQTVAAPTTTTTNNTSIAISTQLNVQTTNAASLGRSLELNWLAIGYATAGDPQPGQLAEGTEQAIPFTLEANNCYALAAAGVDSVTDLGLSLNSPSGGVVDTYLGKSSKPNIRVCPTASGTYMAKVKMNQGGGDFRVSLFRWTEGASGAGLQGLMYLRSAEIFRLLRADNYAFDSSNDTYRGEIRNNATVNRNVSLEGGNCYAFVAIGGDGVNSLALKILKGTSALASESSGSGFPVLRYCPPGGGTHKVEIKSVAGGGPHMFRVFRRAAATSGSGS